MSLTYEYIDAEYKKMIYSHYCKLFAMLFHVYNLLILLFV